MVVENSTLGDLTKADETSKFVIAQCLPLRNPNYYVLSGLWARNT